MPAIRASLPQPHNAVAARSLARHRSEVETAEGPGAAVAGSPILRARLTEGIEIHRVEGVQVAVYSPGKTVADCFKFRRKIGLDVALEALRECWRDRRADMDELWRFAKICRVANVMRPYLESLE